jgi:hypothetical protein
MSLRVSATFSVGGVAPTLLYTGGCREYGKIFLTRRLLGGLTAAEPHFFLNSAAFCGLPQAR